MFLRYIKQVCFSCAESKNPKYQQKIEDHECENMTKPSFVSLSQYFKM